jgi:hypothetical protein
MRRESKVSREEEEACPREGDHSPERCLAHRHRRHCRERGQRRRHQASFDDLVTSDRAACESAHLGEFRLAPPWLTINCFVIRSRDRLLLVGFRIRRTD